MSACVEAYIPTGWARLDWDSERFGFPAARISPNGTALDDSSLSRILKECGAQGIRHLVARVDIADLRAVHALERAGFELLDGIQTFALSVHDAPAPCPKHAFAVRLFRPSDRARVLAIARTAFVYDRFHADSALAPGVASSVNEAWVDNCCRGVTADAVLVAEDADSVLGFVTCKLDRGRRTGVIGMVATGESFRRRGVARANTEAALRWFARSGAISVEVGTQLANLPAARLYQRLGFRSVAIQLTFRKLL